MKQKKIVHVLGEGKHLSVGKERIIPGILRPVTQLYPFSGFWGESRTHAFAGSIIYICEMNPAKVIQGKMVRPSSLSEWWAEAI